MVSMSAVLVTAGARMMKVAARLPAWKCRTMAGTATLSMEELRPRKNAVSATTGSARRGDNRGAGKRPRQREKRISAGDAGQILAVVTDSLPVAGCTLPAILGDRPLIQNGNYCLTVIVNCYDGLRPSAARNPPGRRAERQLHPGSGPARHSAADRQSAHPPA